MHPYAPKFAVWDYAGHGLRKTHQLDLDRSIPESRESLYMHWPPFGPFLIFLVVNSQKQSELEAIFLRGILRGPNHQRLDVCAELHSEQSKEGDASPREEGCVSHPRRKSRRWWRMSSQHCRL